MLGLTNDFGRSKSSTSLSLLVDSVSLASDPRLAYLLSFVGVEGLEIEQNVRIVEDKVQVFAELGTEGLHRASLSPLKQFRRFAAEIAGRPGSHVGAEPIERALAFSHLATLLHADAIVSPVRQALGPKDARLLRVPILWLVEVVDGRAAARLRILAAIRNSVHEIPLDEYLNVSTAGSEHRAMFSPELAETVMKEGREAGTPADYGLFLGSPDPPSMNVGQFAERMLEWSFMIYR